MKSEKMAKNMIIKVVALAVLLSPAFSSAGAEEFPANYSGPGYRPYLDGKIQYGYYVGMFVYLNQRQEERVSKRKQIEEVLNYAYQATPQSNYTIMMDKANLKYQADRLNSEIESSIQKGRENAAANGEFNYVKNSDGKISYFTDGLTTTILHERVLDEFGNLNLKDTRNIKYNDKRLMVQYDAVVTDDMGNANRQSWTGQYTEDSVFYGSDETRANKHLREYNINETDSAGNQRYTEWKALSYDGKLLRAFSQYIDDKLYGTASFTRSNIAYLNNDSRRPYSYLEEGYGTNHLPYSTNRLKTEYNSKDQETAYSEESILTQLDGTKTRKTEDVVKTYVPIEHAFGPDVEEPEPDFLNGMQSSSTVENADGSYRIEKGKTEFVYDRNNKVTGGFESSTFYGQEAQWLETKDASGHILSTETDDNGNTTYAYIDPDTSEKVAVEENKVTAALKNGSYYSGASETQYEAIYGRPRAKETYSKVSYYAVEPQDNLVIAVEETTSRYTNGIVKYLDGAVTRLQVLGTTENTLSSKPIADPDNIHNTKRYYKRSYVYEENGNLKDVALDYAEGSGWEYENGQWLKEYRSCTVNEAYSIILGKPYRTYHEEELNLSGKNN